MMSESEDYQMLIQRRQTRRDQISRGSRGTGPVLQQDSDRDRSPLRFEDQKVGIKRPQLITHEYEQDDDIEVIDLATEMLDVSVDTSIYDEFVSILDEHAAKLTSTNDIEHAIGYIGYHHYEQALSSEQVSDIAHHYYEIVGARLSHIYKLLVPEAESAERAVELINAMATKDMPGSQLVHDFSFGINANVVGVAFAINPVWNIAIPAGGSEERVRETAGTDSINDTKIKFFAAKDFKYKDASNTDQTISNIVGDKVEARLTRFAPRGESADVNADQSDLMKNKLVYNNHGNNANEKGWIRGHLLNDNLGGSALKFNLYPITGAANKEHHSRVEHHVKNLVEAGYVVEYKVEVLPVTPAPYQKETAVGYRSGVAPKANLLCSVKVLASTSTDSASTYHSEGSFAVTVVSEYKQKHASSGDTATLKAFTNKAVKSADTQVDGKAYMRPWTSRKGLTKPVSLGNKEDKHIRDKDYTDWTAKQKSSKFWTWDQTRIDALKAALKG